MKERKELRGISLRQLLFAPVGFTLSVLTWGFQVCHMHDGNSLLARQKIWKYHYREARMAVTTAGHARSAPVGGAVGRPQDGLL